MFLHMFFCSQRDRDPLAPVGRPPGRLECIVVVCIFLEGRNIPAVFDRCVCLWMVVID